MLGLGGFPSIWPLQDHKRPLGFRGLLSATDPQETLTVCMARRQVSERSGRTTEGLTANHLAKADLQVFIDISLIWPGNQSFGM